MDFVTPRAARLVWADLIKASVPYATSTLQLYTNDFTPTENSVVADFTEATFTGYSAQAITWGTAFIDAIGEVHLPGDNNFFLCSGGAGENIFGYYVLGAAGQLLGGKRLDNAPYPIAGAGYGIDVVPEVIV